MVLRQLQLPIPACYSGFIKFCPRLLFPTVLCDHILKIFQHYFILQYQNLDNTYASSVFYSTYNKIVPKFPHQNTTKSTCNMFQSSIDFTLQLLFIKIRLKYISAVFHTNQMHGSRTDVSRMSHLLDAFVKFQMHPKKCRVTILNTHMYLKPNE